MIHWSKLPLQEQIFTHIDPETKVETVFAATTLRKVSDFLVSQGIHDHIFETPIEAHVAKMILERRGIELPRLRRARQTKDYLPLLYCLMPDATHLLIDGSHTYVARWRKGHRHALAYVVPERVWREAVVVGLPATSEEELLSSYSGIPA